MGKKHPNYPKNRKVREFNPETYKKISKALKGKERLKIRGINHHNWKDGRSSKPCYSTFINQRRRARKTKNGGNHTRLEWDKLLVSYNYSCACCKKTEPEIKLTEDHIIPLVKGGSDNIENIQPLCASCNSKKYDKVIKY